jgi:hypothetical protein
MFKIFQRNQDADAAFFDGSSLEKGFSPAEYKSLCKMRLRHLVPVHEPLVLVSQIQRSGGTLLAQLFDSHPQCHAFPPEFDIGHPGLADWPMLDLDEHPDRWFEMLSDEETGHRSRAGYSKYHKVLRRNDLEAFRRELSGLDILPFVFALSLQRAVFDYCVETWEIGWARDVFDAYLTSYFNAWLDNQNLYSRPKKVVTAFKPNVSNNPDNVARFLEVYPDGRLVSIVREPKNWYASRKHGDTNMSKNIAKWKRSVETLVEQKRDYGPRVNVIAFEDLILQTEPVMRSLAGFLGIDFHPVLLEPTFNGFPIKADSSFPVESYGIIEETVSRYEAALTDEECAFIDESTHDVYECALALRTYEDALVEAGS